MEMGLLRRSDLAERKPAPSSAVLGTPILTRIDSFIYLKAVLELAPVLKNANFSWCNEFFWIFLQNEILICSIQWIFPAPS